MPRPPLAEHCWVCARYATCTCRDCEANRPAVEGAVVPPREPGLYIHTGIPWTEEQLKARGLHPSQWGGHKVVPGSVEAPEYAQVVGGGLVKVTAQDPVACPS